MNKPLAWFTEFSKWIAEAAGHPISFGFALLTMSGQLQDRCLFIATLGSL